MVSRHFLSWRPSVAACPIGQVRTLTRMAQGRTTLKVAPREVFGSRATRRLRRDGLVPGVVYGGGKDARAFQVGERDLRGALSSGSAVLDLVFDGSKGTPVVIKDQQLHPVGGQVEHVD